MKHRAPWDSDEQYEIDLCVRPHSGRAFRYQGNDRRKKKNRLLRAKVLARQAMLAQAPLPDTGQNHSVPVPASSTGDGDPGPEPLV